MTGNEGACLLRLDHSDGSPCRDQPDQGGGRLDMIAHHYPDCRVAWNPGALEQALYAPGNGRDIRGAPPAPAALDEIAVGRGRDEIVQAIDKLGRLDHLVGPFT